MFTTSTATTKATAVGLPDFDAVAIYLSVALFHWIVCIGFEAIAMAMIVAPILSRTARRLTKGIHLIAFEAQLTVLSQKPSVGTQLVQLTPLVPTVTTITKISPAMPAMTNHGTHTCVLLTSSTGSATQRANASRARDMLHDLGVAFREMDATETPLSVVRRYSQVSKTHGVYPQLFVEPTPVPSPTETPIFGDRLRSVCAAQADGVLWRVHHPHDRADAQFHFDADLYRPHGDGGVVAGVARLRGVRLGRLQL